MADEPNTPDLAGYADTDKLVQAYRASGAEAKKHMDRAAMLERELNETRSRQVPQRDQSGRFQARPEDRLAEFGVPVDALSDYMTERVNSSIAAAFAPLAQGFQARNTLLSTYGDYNKYEADVAQFVNADPELSQRYQKMFASDPVGAMEYAFLKFGQNRKAETPAPGLPKREASIPSGNSSQGTPTGSSSSDENLRVGWDQYQKTGNPNGYARARLRGVISDEFLSK